MLTKLKGFSVFYFLIAIILFALLVGVFYFFVFKHKGTSTSSYQELKALIPTYSQGEQLLASGNPNDAIKPLEEARSKVANPKQSGYVDLTLGFSYAYSRESGLYKKSIPLLAGIIKNTEYRNSIKSRAAEAIADLILIRQDTASLVAQNEPFNEFFAASGGNVRDFRKRILQYASSFSPLASVEMKLAAAAGEEASRLESLDPSSTKTKIDSENLYLEGMQHVYTGLKNLRSTEQVPYAKVYQADALVHQAIAYRYFRKTTSGKNLEDPTGLFQQAAEAAKEYPPLIPFVNYHYAAYLAEQHSDIVNIKPLLNGFSAVTKNGASQIPNLERPAMEAFFLGERHDTFWSKMDLLNLSNIDPDFKQYLQKIGWEDSDFNSH